MKTKMMILAAFFSLQVSTLFAGNDLRSVGTTDETMTINMSILSPVTPSEATFEEVPPVLIEPGTFAPVVPVEAEFEEMPQDLNISGLAPVTPAEADFE